ncbi:uroporphyrinogen-III C-methyltransferase [uncultured Alsobacter sp.]|uniref:uroporphyrinogen-III C-methyltransferase n=1 Tax=uncultured Alsobacter sp. TaxID=1748258 RepID=UPI0025D025D6|nr:uroporphyrinogen-III C-methyltransferase [uncultured Alsobacter sp.]
MLSFLELLDRATARWRKVPGPGRVLLVGAGPGSPDLLTVRAVAALQAADVVVHDQLVPGDIVALAPARARRIDVGKRKGRHSATQAEINALIVSQARAGRIVVRLKAGDPGVFGRVGEEIAALTDAGVAFEVIPGITAAVAAAADAGVPLTLRGVAPTVTFISAHGADGSSARGWSGLASEGGTLAIYMGKSAGALVRDRLVATGMDLATPVIAVENAGREQRRIIAGHVADLPSISERSDLDGPVVILAGPAMAVAEPRALSHQTAA